MSSSLALDHLASGKVREIYDAGDGRLLLVASDRISAFDVVLPTPIPDKGRVLTALSLHWFALTDDIVRNHVISAQLSDFPEGARDPDLAGRALLVRRLEMLPLECVVRGYLVGSGWKDYGAHRRRLRHSAAGGPARGRQAAAHALHAVDQGRPRATTRTSRAAQGIALVGEQRYREVERASIALYERAAAAALERGIILADTKFEFGIDSDGSLVVGDEVLTPDSSRFWPADELCARDRRRRRFDKQFVRDWLETQAWDKTPPGPELPDEVRDGTAARYREAYERLAGRPWAAYREEMGVRDA